MSQSVSRSAAVLLATRPAVPLRLLSVQVGRPVNLGVEGAEEAFDRPWTSAIHKVPVTGPVWVGREGLAGDGHADGKAHGGPEKAVLASAAEHLPFWRELLGREDVGPGAFGENLLVEGLTEEGVAIGDTFRCGGAVLQVSQPRLPCWKQARRWRRRDLALVMQTTGRTGWYLRVLEEGAVEAGSTLHLLERPCPEWTVARVSTVLHGRPVDRDAAAALAALPWLAPSLRASLGALAGGATKDPQARLFGTE